MVVERIKEARYSFYNEQFDQVSQEAKDFISALLQKSPEFRMTAANALLHPWIKTLVQVGENSWPMARLDVSRLKTFNARRKWHVSNNTRAQCSNGSVQLFSPVSILQNLGLCPSLDIFFSLDEKNWEGQGTRVHIAYLNPMPDFHSVSVLRGSPAMPQNILP